MVLERSTPERRAIYEKLSSKEWFRNTDTELQKKLMSLPDKGKKNHDGFLEDLADRPETVSNIKVERMIDLPHGNFVLVPKFEVSRKDNPNMRYTYEYASWLTGPLSGAKGVVFVETDGKLSHFIVLKGEKFATAKPGFDSVGGLMEKGTDGVETTEDRMKVEIGEELGNKDITVRRIQHLGSVHPDAGLTNERPDLFAAVIGAEELKKIHTEPVNGDITELQSGTVVVPIEKLPDIVMTNTDGFFLSIIARAWAKGIIPPPQTLEGKSVGFLPN